LAWILACQDDFSGPPRLTRDRLTELYGEEFAVWYLPAYFRLALAHAVCRDRDRLILGEYGEGSRIACLTAGSCTVNRYYETVPGVRHIHSILQYGENGTFLVTTGDGTKVLDLWCSEEGGISFVRRLRTHLAGFTAAARVGGEYYFGSDFSSRPNFIETLEGAKYFFPAKAYRRFVTAFYICFDRYIVSVNSDLGSVGGGRTLSVFDTVPKHFVYCDDLVRVTPGSSGLGIPSAP